MKNNNLLSLPRRTHELNLDGTLKLVIVYEVISNPNQKDIKYLRKLSLRYIEEEITKRYVEIIYFFEVLKRFSTGITKDERELFFKLTNNDEAGKNTYLLQCLFDKEQYVGKIEAGTIHRMYYQSLQGYSPIKILGKQDNEEKLYVDVNSESGFRDLLEDNSEETIKKIMS